MKGLLFSNAALLCGLAALAIPIIVHLLLKQKARRQKFSTIQFFRKPDARSTRRKKVQNWLLLAARLLLLALLVTAFARPYLPKISLVADQTHQHAVFVLDRSASMQTREGGASRAKVAAGLIKEALKEFGPEDRVALVGCGSRSEILASLVPPQQLLSQLDGVSPEFGSSDLGEGLQAALKVLQSGPVGPSPRIYIVSDLQRTACRSVSSYSVPKEIDVRTLPAGAADTPNVAIIDLQEDPHAAQGLRATIANFSQKNVEDLKLEVLLDEKPVSTEAINISAAANTNIVVKLPSLTPGWHSAEARIGSKDAFTLDDVHYLAIQAPEPELVLCVESRSGVPVAEQETFFFTSALNPFSSGTNHASTKFTVEKCNPDELQSKLTTAPSPAVVVIPGLRHIPDGFSAALASYVKGGGGLLMFVAEGVSGSRYNEEFRDFMPAVLGNAQGDPSRPEDFWHLQDVRKDAEIFSAFRAPQSGDFSVPVFKRRLAIAPLESPQVLANFSDGAPTIITREYGAGRVILINTSIDTTWTDWPKHKTYLPLMHGLARYLAKSASTAETAADDQFVTATTAELRLGAIWKGELVGPEGKKSAITSDQTGTLRFELDRLGIFSIWDDEGHELRRLAANLPVNESDLAGFTPPEFEKLLVRGEGSATNIVSTTGPEVSQSNERHFWQMLMIAALVLLLLEPLAANRMYA